MIITWKMPQRQEYEVNPIAPLVVHCIPRFFLTLLLKCCMTSLLSLKGFDAVGYMYLSFEIFNKNKKQEEEMQKIKVREILRNPFGFKNDVTRSYSFPH